MPAWPPASISSTSFLSSSNNKFSFYLVKRPEADPVLPVELGGVELLHGAGGGEPGKPLGPAGVHHRVVAELDQHQVGEEGEVGGVAGVLGGTCGVGLLPFPNTFYHDFIPAIRLL